MTKLPVAFIETTRQLMGDERFCRYMESFEADVPVSIRLNPKKSLEFRGERLEVRDGEPVPWCELGYYLPSRPNFTFDPLFHAGCYYVQEAASMFVHHVLQHPGLLPPTSDLRLLDLCAAPGGKSTCAVAALPPGTELWSNEPVAKRASILLENVTKWGYPNCHVTNNYPCDYVRSGLLFDVILCDVPCSGEGMFRRDPLTIGEWSQQNVEKCWRLQREIVADAWKCLRSGGILIYSTCTFNTKENEENVRWMIEHLGAEPLPVELRPEWNITGSLLPGFEEPVYRFIPGITRSEGLFMAVMRKPASADDGRSSKRKDKRDLLKIVHSIEKYEPSTPTVELAYKTAIGYLRGEAIVLPSDAPRGVVAVAFQGHPLGPVKNIGSRANNLYPKEWRIKSTYIPETYETIFTTA